MAAMRTTALLNVCLIVTLTGCNDAPSRRDGAIARDAASDQRSAADLRDDASAPPADQGTPADTGAPADQGAPTDGPPPADTGTPADAPPAADTGTPVDQGTPADQGPPADQSPAPDAAPPGAITHGDQLTKAHVGPAAIGLSGSVDITPQSIYTTKPAWVTRTVGPGGETIDGFAIPAGVWVVEDCNVKHAFQIYGNEGSGTAYKGIVFRGCRMRFSETVIPSIYVREHANAPIWLLYCDMGSPSSAQGNMVPIGNIDGEANAGTYVYRSYISTVSTGIQINAENGHVIESYVEDLLLYEPSLHLNGFTTNGGIQGIEILRNHIVVGSTDSAGHTIDQTDAISFFQDFGDFQGTAPGGYQVRDNFIGGGGYALYAGMNAGKPPTSVRNMVVTGNKFTTIGTWPNSGYWGPVTAEPVWGQHGNVWSNNTWADGPKAGQPL